LGSPAAFPERVDRIQAGEERGGLLGESLKSDAVNVQGKSRSRL
jgi:hypothetical protein